MKIEFDSFSELEDMAYNLTANDRKQLTDEIRVLENKLAEQYKKTNQVSQSLDFDTTEALRLFIKVFITSGVFLEQRLKRAAILDALSKVFPDNPETGSSNKIMKIKFIRSVTGCGLKEAKEYVEQTGYLTFNPGVV